MQMDTRFRHIVVSIEYCNVIKLIFKSYISVSLWNSTNYTNY